MEICPRIKLWIMECKQKIIYDDKTFESENALLSIERSRNGIYLLTLNGTVVKLIILDKSNIKLKFIYAH